MRIDVLVRAAGMYGGNSTFSLIGQYLSNGLGYYGAVVSALELIVCFRGGKVRHPSLQRSYDEYHAEFLPSLPKVKLHRKKGRLELLYQASITDASFLEKHGVLSAELFRTATAEVADRLHLIDAILKKSDEFDLKRFHEDVAELAATVPGSDDDLKQLQAKMDEIQRARIATMDPWEKLDIDWDDYHPQARELLDDPFFWSSTDDFAPHGNDTGADLLADFRRWNRRNADQSAHRVVDQFQKGWGCALMGYDVADQASLKAITQEERIALDLTDEAYIAAAFAAIKVRGFCDQASRDLALSAIARQRTMASLADHTWPHRDERLQTLELMKGVLEG